MKLIVREKETGKVIHGDETLLDWSFDVTQGQSIYTFTGSHSERKLLAFKNIATYKNALNSLLNFFDAQLIKIKQKFGGDAQVQNHNFIETCKHIRDPIRGLYPDLRGASNHNDKVSRVAAHLKSIPCEEIAFALLNVDRSITNLQTQIVGLEIIAGDYVPTLREHNLRDAMEAIVSPFKKDIKELSIRFHNNIPESILVPIDFELLNFAFYHVLNNAMKYSRPGSDLKLFYEGAPHRLVLEMISLKVEEGEEKEIFVLGKRGQHAVEHFSGDGLGMAFAAQSLNYMGARIEFESRNDTCELDDGDVIRCKNNVLVYFDRNSSLSK